MPTKIYVKYHSYDKSTDTIIVSFASDETESNNPENYPPVAVQPLTQFPGITNQKELEDQIASVGYSVVAQQKTLETCRKGNPNAKLYEALVKKGTSEHTLDN